jgi:hypothetical protein
MSTGIALGGEGRVEIIETSGGENATPATITTTLYDLLAALQEVVHPGEEELAVATVVSMLCAGRLTWCNSTVVLESLQDVCDICRREERTICGLGAFATPG